MLPVVQGESQDAALAADSQAAKALALAGFDPAAFVRYIERVQPQAYDIYAGLPARDQRLARMRLVIEHLPTVAYAGTDPEFTQVRNQVQILGASQSLAPAPPTLGPQ